ncbi:S9 family peptidase [Ideonella azotifigens]|uniref:S9 family peptidase n=1 Tax=Ideonella azotifigens TaxID=513160 RepID=A0ABN1K1R6_9BURK|nr:S9 family peptidase [Ideonella azotifigens]MCD2341756.1 S9 family peptidase [Ideonella azotifigens]
MARSDKTFTIDALWQLERLGNPSLSPDGAQAVATVSRYDMEENKASTTLWLLSTLGGRPRALTHCGDKDGQPRFSPHEHAVGFIARREQQGKKDETPQFYVIATDGGEARRVGEVATGIEAFKWFPDGKRIAFISWLWPELKGMKAQAKQHKAFKDRKATGYVTSESAYRFWDQNLPQGRVPHLLTLDLASGKVTDLFEGTPYELPRFDPDATCFDISPDGKRIVFAYDPAPEKKVDGRFAMVELDLRQRRFRELVRDADWDTAAPRYSPTGDRIAFLASHQGRKHTMPAQLAVFEDEFGSWEVISAQWDHAVNAPLLWEDDGQAVLFTAEQQGRSHVWRFDLPDRRAEIVVQGGTVTGFDKASGTLVSLADTAQHPAQLCAHAPGEKPRRIESFNDELLARYTLGHHEEVWFTGAEGDKVQMWLHFPPGFDAKKKYPVLHSIHGGPHTGPGDNWHYRWSSKLFAAQGYVVASVNYHGSSGFGHAFLDSITHRWGELELQDVEAGTDWLLSQRWCDPARVFASGGSYGGYMVAWMNGHVKPGRYAAYVCHAGCFDWTAMFADDAWSWHAKELGAWYWEDPAKVGAQSPHVFAANFSTPTLVIHGALDYRVPDQQGLAYYNTLKARGIDSRLLWFPDENHWVLKPRNSQLWYQEFFAWLHRHDVTQQKGKAKAKRGKG